MITVRADASPLLLSPDRPGGRDWGPDRAEDLMRSALAGQPNRLAHSAQAGARARCVLAAVPVEDGELLLSAALLHDVGYASAARRTGFHPIDGARWLLSLGAPHRLAALVAHHSEARLLAEAEGLAGALVAFAHESSAVSDALIYADMTAGPAGAPISVSDRLDDIAARHAQEDPALVAARQARVPRLLAAVERVQIRAVVASIG
jgi:hypothetical protein